MPTWRKWGGSAARFRISRLRFQLSLHLHPRPSPTPERIGTTGSRASLSGTASERVAPEQSAGYSVGAA